MQWFRYEQYLSIQLYSLVNTARQMFMSDFNSDTVTRQQRFSVRNRMKKPFAQSCHETALAR